MDFLLTLQSMAQGVVQGITEWLPISSTGHIKLLNAVWPMNMSEEFKELFEVVIQLGSIIAVILLFFHKLNPFSSKKTKKEQSDTWKMWGKVAVASIPSVIVGLLIDDAMNSLFQSNPLSEIITIAVTLFIYGVLFLIIEGRHKTPRIQSMDQMSFTTALFIGMFQMLALIPGTSRSGSTIIGATLLGTSRTVAAEFSFFMAIPVMLGASGLKCVKLIADGVEVSSSEWIALAVGTVVSFLVSLVVIRFFMGFIKKHDFKPFGWYRIALALVLAVVLIAAPQVFQ